MRRQELETALHAVPDFPTSDATLEQYKTPAAVAAGLLWEANQDGCIKGKHVLDLGCGTGVLAYGAHLLGATVTGIDVDEPAVELARALVPGDFIVGEVATADLPDVDTAIMNPPFGSQMRHADRIFYRRAVEAVTAKRGTIWFLQQPTNERFLHSTFKEYGMKIERVALWDYPLEARFQFHNERVRTIPVGGYVATF